jgi:hypothetical protein
MLPEAPSKMPLFSYHLKEVPSIGDEDQNHGGKDTGEHIASDPVDDAAVPFEDIAIVFDAEIAFDHAESQIAQIGNERQNDRQSATQYQVRLSKVGSIG